MRRSAVPLLWLVVAVNACEIRKNPIPQPDPEFVTVFRLTGAQMRIAEYSRVHGYPPATLADVCEGGLQPSCAKERPDSTRDGWGTGLAYIRDGDDYELRSGGIDRRMNTPDDLVVRSSRVRAQVGEIAGCYAIPAPRHGRYPGHRVMLDSTTLKPGIYRARMVPPSPAQWYPLGSVASLELLAGRFVIPFVLRREGDDLVGYEGSPWTPREPVRLKRIPCTPELAGSLPSS